MPIWDWDFEPLSWDPWADLARARERMESLLRRVAPAALRAEFPFANVWSGDQKAVVEAEIPGAKPQDLEVSVQGDDLTIRCSRPPEETKEGERYLRQERWHGEFSRSVQLPFPVDEERVSATYKDGILSVELPRAAAAKPSRIPVES